MSNAGTDPKLYIDGACIGTISNFKLNNDQPVQPLKLPVGGDYGAFEVTGTLTATLDDEALWAAMTLPDDDSIEQFYAWQSREWDRGDTLPRWLVPVPFVLAGLILTAILLWAHA